MFFRVNANSAFLNNGAHFGAVGTPKTNKISRDV